MDAAPKAISRTVLLLDNYSYYNYSCHMTSQELQVVLALGTEAKHGYAIMQHIADESAGKLRILPGTLYSTIKKLLAAGLVEECDAPRGTVSSDERRRYYRVTKSGRVAAQDETERLALLLKLGRAFR
jgi:DNA-binding PadR family transcriptional regulator